MNSGPDRPDPRGIDDASRRAYAYHVHATYPANLREVNELNFARFDARAEQRFAEAEARFEQRFAQTDASSNRGSG